MKVHNILRKYMTPNCRAVTNHGRFVKTVTRTRPHLLSKVMSEEEAAENKESQPTQEIRWS